MTGTVPALFINSRQIPYLAMITNHIKLFETRSKNMLKSMLEQFPDGRVLLVETGRGDPLVKATARIDHVVTVRSAEEWNDLRLLTQVPPGDEYDWKPGTKVKYLYHLSDVHRVAPFPLPADSRRHGRTWAEFTGAIP